MHKIISLALMANMRTFWNSLCTITRWPACHATASIISMIISWIVTAHIHAGAGIIVRVAQ